MAWLHEVLEWTSVSEEELLAEGVSDDELRALRLLTRTLGRGSESAYLAHITMIARAGGPAGVLARTVKVSDLKIGCAIPVRGRADLARPTSGRCG